MRTPTRARCFEYIQKDVGGTRVYVLTYVELIPTVYTHTQLWLLPTDWSPLPETCAGPNPMFSLIEGMSAKTIRGSNNSLNHIGFLHTKHFPWEAVGIQMNTDVKCKQLSVAYTSQARKTEIKTKEIIYTVHVWWYIASGFHLWGWIAKQATGFFVFNCTFYYTGNCAWEESWDIYICLLICIL